MATSGPSGGKLPALSEETLKDLLAVQKQELAIRLKEIERDSSAIDHNKSLAQQSIQAQERDRKHKREESTKRQKTHQNFVFSVLAVVLLFSAYALYIGQSALVLDFAKMVVGFVGGMGYWAYRQSRRDKD